MAALRTALADVPNVQTVGTVLLNHDQVSNQPALFPVLVRERTPAEPYNLYGPCEMTVEIWVYTRGTERTDGDLEAALFDVIDGVYGVLAPDPITNENTLGDLVTSCKIDGFDSSPGHAEGQAAAVVDVTILTLPN